MTFDSNGFIVLEQEGFPGNIGDSCAETSRYVLLKCLVNEKPSINLRPFVTPAGVIRYPTSPWGVDDTSDDQVSPLIAATAIVDPALCASVIGDVEDAGWKTGNGQLIHPTSFAQIMRAQNSFWIWFLDIFIFIQALIFKIPYRWNDSTKWFTKSAGSSSDYLNFTNYLAFASLKGNLNFFCRMALKMTPETLVSQNVQSYYAIEPNNQMILDLYTRGLKIIYGG